MQKLLIVILVMLVTNSVAQKAHVTVKDIAYYPANIIKSDKYIQQQCKLDIHYPKDSVGFATIVWFHGGGLKAGSKEIPKELTDKGVCIVSVAYRFSPDVKAPAYIEDAAAAVSWVYQHIAEYGGTTDRIFLSGHSAGAYLSGMLTLDKSYLAKHNIDSDKISGFISLSSQTITHFTIREEMGLQETDVLVDKYALLHHVRKSTPPILLITGDRELELLGRYEENAYLWRMFRLVGNENVRLFELQGFDHGSCAQPGVVLLLKEVQRLVKKK